MVDRTRTPTRPTCSGTRRKKNFTSNSSGVTGTIRWLRNTARKWKTAKRIVQRGRLSLETAMVLLFIGGVLMSEAKIMELAMDRFRVELPFGARMVQYFTDCDEDLYSKPFRPEGCQVDTFASKFAYELFALRLIFESEFVFPLTTCDPYLELFNEMQSISEICRAGTTTTVDYWPLNCLMLQEEVRVVYRNRTSETNINCNLLTKARTDALNPPEDNPIQNSEFVNCNELADAMLAKYQPFRYTQDNITDADYAGNCRSNMCTFYKFFFEKIRPRKMQLWNGTMPDVEDATPLNVTEEIGNGTNGTENAASIRMLEEKPVIEWGSISNNLSSDMLFHSRRLRTSQLLPPADILEQMDQDVVAMMFTGEKHGRHVSYYEINRMLRDEIGIDINGVDEKPSSSSGIHAPGINLSDEKNRLSLRDLEYCPSVKEQKIYATIHDYFHAEKDPNNCRRQDQPDDADTEEASSNPAWKNNNENRDLEKRKIRIMNTKRNSSAPGSGAISGRANLFDPSNFRHQLRLQKVLRELEGEHDSNGVAISEKPVGNDALEGEEKKSSGPESVAQSDEQKQWNKKQADAARKRRTSAENWERSLRLQRYADIVVVDDIEADDTASIRLLIAEANLNKKHNHQSIGSVENTGNQSVLAARLEKAREQGLKKQRLADWLEDHAHANPFAVFLRHSLRTRAFMEERRLSAKAANSRANKLSDNTNTINTILGVDESGGLNLGTWVSSGSRQDFSASGTPKAELSNADAARRYLQTPPYPLWPPNFYLDGCNAISYFPFDEYQCQIYQEGQAFCECIIPQLHNPVNQVDSTCIPEYQKWFMFGRRGLIQGQMSEACMEGLKEFFWKVRDIPACKIADLPNRQETEFLVFPDQMMATRGLEQGQIVGNDMFDKVLSLAKTLQETYPSCPWMSHSGEDDIMECMDMFRCNVQIDGWDCCSKPYNSQRAKEYHYVEAFHTDATLCCPHEESYNILGETFIQFSRPIPSDRPQGNRRCPKNTPQMCDYLSTGYGGEFACSNLCDKRRSCSPVIYPEPFLLSVGNDTQGFDNMFLEGNGCCRYTDMLSRHVDTTSKNACLYLCSINPECLGATVSVTQAAIPCRHHVQGVFKSWKLDGFYLGCRDDASGQSVSLSDKECWLNERVVTGVPAVIEGESNLIILLLYLGAGLLGCALLVPLWMLFKLGVWYRFFPPDFIKHQIDPIDYEMEQTRMPVAGIKNLILAQDRSKEEKLAVLESIGKVVRSGQKNMELEDRLGSRRNIAADRDPNIQVPTWRESNEARKERVARDARNAGLSVESYIRGKTLECSKGMRDPKQVKTLNWFEAWYHTEKQRTGEAPDLGGDPDATKRSSQLGESIDVSRATMNITRDLDKSSTLFGESFTESFVTGKRTKPGGSMSAAQTQYLLSGGLQATDFFVGDEDSELEKSETHMIPIDKFGLSIPGSKLDERILETRFKIDQMIEERKEEKPKVMWASDFQEQAAEEDYYEPLRDYPTLVIQVDLFKGHGGHLGLKFEEPDTTIISEVVDPVMKRWGWRIGDEIVAILCTRRSGDKAWFPTPTFDELYKRFGSIKEDWNEYTENRRLYFGVYRRDIKPGEKFPPIPKALHMITQKFLDDRGSDFDSSDSEEEYFKREEKEAQKKPRVMPRADWLRYVAWHYGTGKNVDEKQEAYERMMEEKKARETGEGKYWQDTRNKATKQEIRWVRDSQGRERIHTMTRGLDIQYEKQLQNEKEKSKARKQKLKDDIKAHAMPKRQFGFDMQNKFPQDEHVVVTCEYGEDLEEAAPYN